MISIDCDVLHVCFDDHVNVIGSKDGLIFDSGTRKSFLFEMLKEQQVLKKLKSNCSIRFADSPYVLAGISLKGNDCIVIDEANFAPKEFDQLFQQVREANAYLIVIGRMYIKQLEYSVDAIYQFSYENGIFEIERAFHNVNSHKENIKLITCEDSTAVASVYTEVLEQDVIPARGRSNFFKYIKSKDTVFVVADKPKFGAELLNLIYRCKTFTSAVNKILLFLPSCFEEIVCELYGLTTGETSAFDLEEYFEDLASKECGWDKDNTALSVKKVRVSADFCDSYILHELKDFYEGKELDSSLRCYNVNLDDIEVELSEENIIKVAIHRDTVDKMRAF